MLLLPVGTSLLPADLPPFTPPRGGHGRATRQVRGADEGLQNPPPTTTTAHMLHLEAVSHTHTHTRASLRLNMRHSRLHDVFNNVSFTLESSGAAHRG